MTRDAFHHELQELEEAVVLMATLVEAAVANSVQALIQRDVDLAQQVIDGDATVNEHQRTIRNKTFGVMARQAPVARDLRELVTIQLVINELERMGDHAVGVAKNAIRLSKQAPVKAVVDLPEMAKLIRQQVRDAIQAFVDVNIVAAREICMRDDEVDHLYRQTFDELLVCMRNADNVPQATSLLFVAHDLERIGDRVTNICEDVIYMVTGEIEELN
ncbi:MAG TPA: phosphate signaling complex protein PhoU [Ktedonobacterales bacterium]|jgi:phosphate transport system protein